MISKTCSLVLKDLYFYDFKSAYPRILTNVGWDFTGIDLDNKAERNKAIGLAQRDNENLSQFLMESVANLLQFYAEKNGLTEDDIIVSQRDGFIITKYLQFTEDFLTLDFRDFVQLLIVSPDRNKYLACSDSGITVKGISYRYDELDWGYQFFQNLNFYNKKILFIQLQKIRDRILQCENPRFFMVPVDNGYVVETIRHGQIIVKTEEVFSHKDVNKEQYYDHYFKEFLQAIFLEFY